MASLDPDEAATIAHGNWAGGRPHSRLTSFAIDTRRIQAGETFVALKSDRADGHTFLEKAQQYRAAAALVEHPVAGVDIPQLVVRDSLEALQALARNWRERFHAPMIGITGSVGKTTVKEMLGSVMGSQWFRTHGNYNNHIGVPLSLLELDPRAHAGSILEAGINDVGEMRLLVDLIQPDKAIITAVEPAHLEKLGDLEGVAREKAIMAHAVKPGGEVFMPASLLQYAAFREIPETIRIHALLEAGEVEDPAWANLPNVTLYHYKWTEKGNFRGMGELSIEPPMFPGSFSFQAGSPGMVSNLALVVHVALSLGVPENTIQARLDSWRPFHQRGEMIRKGETVFYVDCYNANPGSLLDSAKRFASLFPDKPHLYLLGSMNELGADSAFWHKETARKLNLQEGAEAYLLGVNAESMAEGLNLNGVDESRIHTSPDPGMLKRRLETFKGAVFVKGSRSLSLESLLPEGGTPC